MASSRGSRVERRVTTLGGKGSSLSSAAFFDVVNALSLIRIDSSSPADAGGPISDLGTTNSHSTLFQFPDFLGSQECRAFPLLLLNKLLLSSNSHNHHISGGALISRLLDALNSTNSTPIHSLSFDFTGVSEPELRLAALAGIAALLDHPSSSLTTIADAVAALSCEALQADTSEAFDLTDSGDSSSSKHDVSVAADLKVLLNGSKRVGKNKSNLVETQSVILDIPSNHGDLRRVSNLLHSTVRVELNSGLGTSPKNGGSGSSYSASASRITGDLSHLAWALARLGRSSWRRAQLNILSIPDEGLRSTVMDLFEKLCPPAGALKQHLDSSFQSALALEEKEEDLTNFFKFAHEIWSLSEKVWKIVSWEATAAFVSLEGTERLVVQKVDGDVPLSSNSDDAIPEKKKKNEKRKKVLGKGTTTLIQFIAERLQAVQTDATTGSGSVLLEKWAEEFRSFLNPRDPGFDDLLKNVKEIVESNESRRLPKLPKGTRDFAKEQMAIREKAFCIIADVFKRHGAMALDTPVFELRETLTGKYGEDSKLIYDLADQGGELCSLRYDLTVPFARYVAMNSLTSFKRYQIAKVYRRDNPSKGRFREFYQCDFDVAGQYERMWPDFEVVKILTELLNDLDIGDYEIKLNHRKLLDGMLEICGVPPEKFRTICSSIDKLDKQSFDQIKKEMVQEKGISAETADKIGAYVKERGHPLELLSKLKQGEGKFLENSASKQALDDLEILFYNLEQSGCIDRVVFDLSLARGLDYYTGVIFEAVFKGATQVGSIAAGGRYDNLIGMFGSKQVPAVGVSLGIERVFTIMEQLEKDRNQVTRPTETQVLVSILGKDQSWGAELASELWAAKLKAECMFNKNIRKHIGHAEGLGIPFLVIVGENERERGIVKIKDMVAARDEDVPRNMVVKELKRRLNISS